MIMEDKNTKMAITPNGLKLLLIGVIVMIAGYVLMMGGASEDPNVFNYEMFDFQRMVAAPVVIICGIVIEVVAIMKKFKSAVTDSDTEHCVRYDIENKPGVANLMSIYSSVTGKSFEEIEREFDGKGYGAFKPAVGEAVIETLRPIREEAERMIADKAYLQQLYTQGAQKAAYVARKTLRKVYKKVGLVEKPF